MRDESHGVAVGANILSLITSRRDIKKAKAIFSIQVADLRISDTGGYHLRIMIHSRRARSCCARHFIPRDDAGNILMTFFWRREARLFLCPLASAAASTSRDRMMAGAPLCGPQSPPTRRGFSRRSRRGAIWRFRFELMHFSPPPARAAPAHGHYGCASMTALRLRKALPLKCRLGYPSNGMDSTYRYTLLVNLFSKYRLQM